MELKVTYVNWFFRWFCTQSKTSLIRVIKKFLETFTITLSEFLHSTNISVSLIAPGQTKSKFLKEIKLKKLNKEFLTPDQVANESIEKIFDKKKIIIPGIYNKFRYFLFKILPNFLIYKIYNHK